MPEQNTPWIVAAVVTPLMGLLGGFTRWLMGRQMQTIDTLAEKVAENTSAVARIATRFEDHMEKEEETDRETARALTLLLERSEK